MWRRRMNVHNDNFLKAWFVAVRINALDRLSFLCVYGSFLAATLIHYTISFLLREEDFSEPRDQSEVSGGGCTGCPAVLANTNILEVSVHAETTVVKCARVRLLVLVYPSKCSCSRQRLNESFFQESTNCNLFSAKSTFSAVDAFHARCLGVYKW